jgi:hypothetical protein
VPLISVALGVQSSARRIQSLALEGESPARGLQSPVIVLQSLEIGLIKNRENRAKLPHFNTF